MTARTRTLASVPVAVALLLTACDGASAPDEPGEPRIIEIDIDGYHFVPDHFTVRRGESVRFRVNNPDDIGHELFIGTIAEQAARRGAGVAVPSTEATTTFGYGIYLPALTDGELDYAFSRGDDLLIGCHLPGHWEAGMVATIDVQP